MRLCSRLVPRSIVSAPHLYLDYVTNLAICQDLFEKMLAVRLERTSSPLPTQPTTPTTDGRTRLERVGWLSGGLPATEAHHLRFFTKSYIFPRRYLARTSWFSGAVFLLPLVVGVRVELTQVVPLPTNIRFCSPSQKSPTILTLLRPSPLSRSVEYLFPT